MAISDPLASANTTAVPLSAVGAVDLTTASATTNETTAVFATNSVNLTRATSSDAGLATGLVAGELSVPNFPTSGTNGNLPLSPGLSASQLLGLLKFPSPSQSYQSTLTNPLHGYESYTYNLSLHLLSETQYNTLIENPDNTYIPQNVLVASGGRKSATFVRNPYFNEDFYFQDFKMKTIVNATSRNRNSNLIECSFTIIEPNGFTFINRLLDAVQGIGSKNYLRQPYLLQIDFFGYQNGVDANGPIPNMSKYIPIALTSMKSRVTTRGTEYQIEAVPYNHQAMNLMNVVTPASFEVKAKTVADVLGTGQVSNQLITSYAQNQREQAELERLQGALNAGGLAPEDAQAARQRLASISATSGQFQVSGLTDAMNSFNKQLANSNGQILYPNTYRVIFDKEIGDASLIPPGNKPNNIANVPTGGSLNNAAANNARAAGGLSVGQIDFQAGVFNIKMGTPIDKVIDFAVRNSDYVRNQLADNTLDTNSVKDISQIQLKLGNSLKWYRIIPKIKIKQYDASREQYSYDITYYVKVWTVNTKHPYAPQGRTPGYVKKYNYIFTGQNSDVLDCQLDFDMMYYTQLTAFRNKMARQETGPTGPTNPDNVGPNAVNVVPKDRIQPYMINHVAQDATTQSRTGPNQSAAVSGGDLQRDITTNSRGDMINIKLKIIGDPQFIKQDDIFYAQNTTSSFNQLTPNGSLYYDNGELYVFVEFQSPNDYDETLGLAVPGFSPYQYSEFSGVYKIITVENMFSNGKFEQVLDLVRLPISDQARNLVTNARTRLDTYVSLGLGQFGSLPYSRFTGPRILINALATGGVLANAPLGAGGSGSSLIQGLLTQTLSSGISKLVSAGVDKIASIFKSDTFSTNVKDYEIFKPTDTNFGAFGEDPLSNSLEVSSVGDINIPEIDFAGFPGGDILDTSVDLDLLDAGIDIDIGFG